MRGGEEKYSRSMTAQQVKYDGEWYSFASDTDAFEARQRLGRGLSAGFGWLHVVDDDGEPVQVLVSPGVPVVFRGEWSADGRNRT